MNPGLTTYAALKFINGEIQISEVRSCGEKHLKLVRPTTLKMVDGPMPADVIAIYDTYTLQDYSFALARTTDGVVRIASLMIYVDDSIPAKHSLSEIQAFIETHAAWLFTYAERVYEHTYEGRKK